MLYILILDHPHRRHRLQAELREAHCLLIGQSRALHRTIFPTEHLLSGGDLYLLVISYKNSLTFQVPVYTFYLIILSLTNSGVSSASVVMSN